MKLNNEVRICAKEPQKSFKKNKAKRENEFKKNRLNCFQAATGQYRTNSLLKKLKKQIASYQNSSI